MASMSAKARGESSIVYAILGIESLLCIRERDCVTGVQIAHRVVDGLQRSGKFLVGLDAHRVAEDIDRHENVRRSPDEPVVVVEGLPLLLGKVWLVPTGIIARA